jgi:hypothetical protein
MARTFMAIKKLHTSNDKARRKLVPIPLLRSMEIRSLRISLENGKIHKFIKFGGQGILFILKLIQDFSGQRL